MPPKRTGTVEWAKDHWKARVRLADGTRPWVHFEVGVTEEQARLEAAEMSAIAAAEGLGRARLTAGPTETVSEWTVRWLDARKASGLTSVAVDRGRLQTHVLPTLGARPIAHVTKAELEDLVEKLDARVVAGELSWRTARNAWGLVTKMFADASGAKIRALRVREDNPADGVRGPDRGVRKTKTYLYPAELLALLSCPEVPLRWRRVFAIAVYTYVRGGELAALRWDAVDLERGVIHVHQSQDRFRERGKVKSTKSGAARKVPIEPALLPLLEKLHRERADDRVIPMPPGEALATRLRTYLLWAGVTRPELHANDATRKHVTFHDLRATGITWCAARGDDPWKIRARAGHATISTTEGYVREVEALGRESFGDVFPALPAELIGPAIGPAGTKERGMSNDSAKVRGVPSGIRSRGRRREERETTGNRGVAGHAEAPPDGVRTNHRTERSASLRPEELAALRREVGVAKALRRGVAAALAGDEDATVAELERAAAGLPWARGGAS